jgi:hypothetical protein
MRAVVYEVAVVNFAVGFGIIVAPNWVMLVLVHLMNVNADCDSRPRG